MFYNLILLIKLIESFAVSGSIGLEAISRGAKRAYFIDFDKNLTLILVKNCKSIKYWKVSNIRRKAFVQTSSYFRLFKKILKRRRYLYVDPWFTEGMEDIYDKSFRMIENTPNR